VCYSATVPWHESEIEVAGRDPATVYVRPFAYVEDHAVVRQVDDDCYLGNWRAADPAHCDWSFEYVLSLSADAYPHTTHHRSMVDGPENDWTAFESTVDTARRLYRREGSLLVHCTAGISRSTTVLATTIAAEEDVTFRDALADVQDARPHAQPHPALHEQAVVYLAARG